MKKILILVLMVFAAGMACSNAWAITVSFGPYGASGSIWGEEISFVGFDASGNLSAVNQVYEWNANLNIGGTSHWLTSGGLPTDISFSYVTNIYDNYFIQTYTFTNTTGSPLSDLAFYSFLDPDLDEAYNGWWNEFGEHYKDPVTGWNVVRQYDPSGTGIILSGVNRAPDYFEINFADYVFDDIEKELVGNYPPNYGPDNLGLALGWELGNLAAGESISVSARVDAQPIPEPSTLILLGSGLISIFGFRRRRAKIKKL